MVEKYKRNKGMIATIQKQESFEYNWQCHEFLPQNERVFFKKTVNRVAQSLQYVFPRQSNHVQDVLNTFVYTGLSEQKKLEVNNKIPELVELLFSKTNEYIDISFSSLDEVIKSLVNFVVSGQGIRNLVVTIGLGASEILPSIRIPSYILDAIKLLRNFKEKRLGLGMPTIRVFKANYIGVYANSFNQQRVNLVSELTFNFLQNFLSQFFSEYLPYFVFESDKPFILTKAFTEIEHLSARIEQTIDISEEVQSLLIMGAKHGGEIGKRNALFYAAAHPLYNQSLNSKENLGKYIFDYIERHPEPKMILDMGGRPQRIFNNVISSLRKQLPLEYYNKPPLVNVIVKSGKIPVYYKAQNGDLMIDEDVNLWSKTKPDILTHFDYDLLFNEIEELDYRSFIREFQKQFLTTNKPLS
jgi:hypothetical protein